MGEGDNKPILVYSVLTRLVLLSRNGVGNYSSARDHTGKIGQLTWRLPLLLSIACPPAQLPDTRRPDRTMPNVATEAAANPPTLQNHKDNARLPYLPGLDGLRAIAVGAVLLYHADPQWLPGGYLGVEVFFVLSGYLITSLLIAEWRAQGSINLPAFWLRRARRLLPALFLLLASTLTFAVLFLPGEVAGLRGDALAAAGYSMNWYLVFGQKSYFELVGRPPMLQHLWSLAVEEQFYLVWPLLFTVMARRWQLKRRMLAAIVAGAVASAGLMALLYQPDADPSRIYYGTDTRATGLLIGCALAVGWASLRPGRARPVSKLRKYAAAFLPDIGGLAALILLGGLFVWLDENEPFLYQGGFVVTGLITLALIIACAGTPSRLTSRLLGWKPLRWLGMRSYGIYLWHWPVYAVTRPQLDLPLDSVPTLVLRLSATLLLAELSYRFVEMPVRRGSLGRAWLALRGATGAGRKGPVLRWGAAGLFAAALIFAVATAVPQTPPDYLSVASIVASPSWPAPSGEPGPATVAISSTLTPTSIPAFTPASAPPTLNTMWATPPVLQEEALSPTPGATAGSSVLVASATATRAAATRTPSLARARKPLPTPTHAAPSPPEEKTQAVAQATVSPPAQAQPTADARATTMPKPSPAPLLSPTAEVAETQVAEATPNPPDSVSSSSQVTLLPPASPIPGLQRIRVLAVGDSVMLGAAPELRRQIPGINIDASVGRQAASAIALLQARGAADELGDVVVIHMGTNGTLSARQFDQMMKPLAGVRRVVFVNDKVPRPWESSNNKVIAQGVARYPNTTMVDWKGISAGQPSLFTKDAIHLQPAGMRLYARLIAQAIVAP